MFEMDKHKFGTFVAALRKEKGYTQKELAAKLYISDKAVSKWETGVSIPDVALLIPLSEALDISVTELLQCRRIEKDKPLDTLQVEDLVKTAITYSEELPRRSIRRKNLLFFAICALAACCQTVIMVQLDCMTEAAWVMLLLSGIFSFYFLVLVREKLPTYYDQNRITAYNDGPLRMNLGSVQIHNRNWPHIVKVIRRWSMGMLAGCPALCIVMHILAPAFWLQFEKTAFLLLPLSGLLVPLFIVGKKFSKMSKENKATVLISLCLILDVAILALVGCSSLLTPKIFNARSGSGTIHVPDSVPTGGMCEITTSSGDVFLEIEAADG